MLVTFCAGLRTARNTKQTANEIRYAEKSEKLEKAIEVTAFVSNSTYRLAASLDEANAKG